VATPKRRCLAKPKAVTTTRQRVGAVRVKSLIETELLGLHACYFGRELWRLKCRKWITKTNSNEASAKNGRSCRKLLRRWDGLRCCRPGPLPPAGSFCSSWHRALERSSPPLGGSAYDFAIHQLEPGRQSECAPKRLRWFVDQEARLLGRQREA